MIDDDDAPYMPYMPLRFDVVTRGDRQVPVWSRSDMDAAYDAGKRAGAARIAELEAALRLIADTHPIDAVLDPQRAIRVARAALEKQP